MQLFRNPYCGVVMDLAAIEDSPTGGKFCPVTKKPLDRAAIDSFDYVGPPQDRARWAADALETVKEIERDVKRSNAETLGLGKK